MQIKTIAVSEQEIGGKITKLAQIKHSRAGNLTDTMF